MSDKLNMADRLSIFLTERRALVITALAVVVVIIITAAVWAPVSDKLAEKDAQTAEQLDELFSDWMYASDEDKSAKEEEFLALASQVLSKSGSSYAGQRALFMRGQYYINKEMWDEASADFILLAHDYPESYLAPVALFNGASTLDEAGKSEDAARYYQELVDGFSDEAPEAAEALFNLGRLAEEGGDSAKAKEYYEALIADYDSSDWKNIAKTRILLMN